MAYRTSVRESTSYTPFKLMFGRYVRLPVEHMFGIPRRLRVRQDTPKG